MAFGIIGKTTYEIMALSKAARKRAENFREDFFEKKIREHVVCG